MASENTSQEGRWFLTALLLTFIILKLTKVIDWSWVWVLAPLWGPLALAVGATIVAYLAGLIETFFARRRRNKALSKPPIDR